MAKEWSIALYNKIKAHKDVYVEECGNVGDLVVKLGAPTGGQFPPFDQIWSRLSNEITSGKFSITGGVSHPMVDCEKEWVQVAINE
jgi:hypothetical protein